MTPGNQPDAGVDASQPLVSVRPMTDDQIGAVVQLWQLTKRAAYPYLPLEQTYTFADNNRFFRSHILPHCAIWVAVPRGAPLGFLAIRDNYIDRLYVHPDHQRRGVGTTLLEKGARALAGQPGIGDPPGERAGPRLLREARIPCGAI